MSTSRRIHRLIAVLIIIGVPAIVRADKPSEVLIPYRQPVERAIDRALAWLAKQQLPAGNFPQTYGATNAVAALSAMAFMCKGYTPGRGPYGRAINRCIDYVLSGAAPNGYMGTRGGRMYSHCAATLMLCEVSGMVDTARQNKIDAVLPKAIQVIIGAQRLPKAKHLAGGWRYLPNSRDSDLSVSGWALMALRSARLNGAPVPKGAIDNAVRFVVACRYPRPPYGFAYTPGGRPTVPLSGAGLLCLELTGHHNSDLAKKTGGMILRYCSGDKFYASRFPHYALYYCSQGMFQLGGAYWERYAEAMYKYLLRRQKPTGAFGTPYQTAMTVLALGVTSRQLPIYQPLRPTASPTPPT